MALVGLGIIPIFKCKHHMHCKSRDIGESCTKRTEPAQKMIGELRRIITPLGDFMFVVLFMYILCYPSL